MQVYTVCISGDMNGGITAFKPSAEPSFSLTLNT